MKYFEDPKAEVVLFAQEDIITESNPTCTTGDGDTTPVIDPNP